MTIGVRGVDFVNRGLLKRFIAYVENTIFFTRAYCGIRYGCSVVLCSTVNPIMVIILPVK